MISGLPSTKSEGCGRPQPLHSITNPYIAQCGLQGTHIALMWNTTSFDLGCCFRSLRLLDGGLLFQAPPKFVAPHLTASYSQNCKGSPCSPASKGQLCSCHECHSEPHHHRGCHHRANKEKNISVYRGQHLKSSQCHVAITPQLP